tara:strand:+ start:1479 stop:2024 length:546 start_codon:yes stop_codon:yes gene_type:complete
MNSLKDTPYLFSVIMLFINVVMISILIFNFQGIDKRSAIINEYSKVNKNNQVYLTGLQSIHATLQKNKNSNIISFDDDYVFDSSTEAIIFRETLRKIGIEASDYLVSLDKSPVFSLKDSDVVATSLKYSFEKISFNKIIDLLELVNNNERFDFFNEMTLINNDNSIELNLSYTNLGNSLEE